MIVEVNYMINPLPSGVSKSVIAQNAQPGGTTILPFLHLTDVVLNVLYY